MSSRHKAWLAEKAKKREAALAEAMKLAQAGQFSEAEQLIKSVDESIQGAVATAHMYRELLKTLVEPDKAGRQSPLAEKIFRKALKWSQGLYPDPHTRMEADDFERGRAEDLAELVEILGYEPPA